MQGNIWKSRREKLIYKSRKGDYTERYGIFALGTSRRAEECQVMQRK